MSRRLASRAVPATGIAVAVGLSGWFNLVGGGLRFQVISCWLAVTVFTCLLSYYAFWASRQMAPTNSQRRFWSAMAVAAAVFAIGDWAQLVTAIAGPLSVPALTGTGIARTAALVIGCAWLAAVLLTYPIPHRSARERLCYHLDLATVVTGAAAYGVYWTLATTADDRSPIAHDLATVLTGPVVVILTAFAMGRLYLSKVVPFSWHIGILGPIAAVVEAVARVVGPEWVAAGHPGINFTMTAGSHLLLMIAGWAQYRSAGAGSDRRRDEPRRRSFSLLPYLALWLTFALLVVTLVSKGFDLRVWIAVAGLAAITGVVVARQLVSFVANEELLAERDGLTARLREMAFTDSLTGLANRAQFLENLDAALHRRDGEVGVLLIDLDDFKPVNDTYGHAAGDTVLVETAERLRRTARPADMVARLGGDEFAILIEDAGLDDIATVADRVVRALGRPCELAGGAVATVRASVGGAVTTGANRDASTLLHTADEAMYTAKSSGKGSFRLAGAAA
ncbi:diguanylate cyclase [Paractinoplanes rhizophilus]|jgi:diguanylate cyclase (GGDEF)-like protein|uniref:Diguanylate cyclase n=1 Tax=Paractinoplanes rhizophilus TaxID=1416877 RepID=A0ABW2HVV1_9ACTN